MCAHHPRATIRYLCTGLNKQVASRIADNIVKLIAPCVSVCSILITLLQQSLIFSQAGSVCDPRPWHHVCAHLPRATINKHNTINRLQHVCVCSSLSCNNLTFFTMLNKQAMSRIPDKLCARPNRANHSCYYLSRSGMFASIHELLLWGKYNTHRLLWDFILLLDIQFETASRQQWLHHVGVLLSLVQ